MGDYLHGIEIIETDSGPRPISGVDASVIGIVGTAKSGEAEADTPYLIAGSRKEAETLFGVTDPTAKTVPLDNTLPYALAGLLDQTSATIVVIKVAVESGVYSDFTDLEKQAATEEQATVAALALVAAAAAVEKAKEELSKTKRNEKNLSVEDLKTAIEKVEQKIKDAGKKHTQKLTTAIGLTKTAETATLAENKFNVTASAADLAKIKAGVEKLVGAESVVHKTPRILIAPGFSHADTTISSALGEAAKRLRGIAIVDGPNADDPGAITAVEGVNNPRIFMVDPWVTVACENEKGENKLRAEPPSSRIAGVIAKSDSQRGFWFSPSNRPIVGISGTSRSVDFSLGDEKASANQLNEKKVATIIHQNGYRLWGNRSCSNDPKWAFISVRRTADLINDALLSAHLWAVDRNINKTYVEDVTEGVNAYLRHLKSTGAIINGKCWADPEENTWDMITQGKVTFDFDFTPPYPAEHITFRSSMVNDYLEEIFA